MNEAPSSAPSSGGDGAAPAAGTEREIAGRLVYFQHPPTSATVRVKLHGAAARMRRAWQALGVCWALMIPAVFIPLAHFILVPGLFIAGPILFSLRLRMPVTLLSTRGACPACGVEQTFTEHGRLLVPQTLRCASCRRQITLEVDTASARAE